MYFFSSYWMATTKFPAKLQKSTPLRNQGNETQIPSHSLSDYQQKQSCRLLFNGRRTAVSLQASESPTRYANPRLFQAVIRNRTGRTGMADLDAQQLHGYFTKSYGSCDVCLHAEKDVIPTAPLPHRLPETTGELICNFIEQVKRTPTLNGTSEEREQTNFAMQMLYYIAYCMTRNGSFRMDEFSIRNTVQDAIAFIRRIPTSHAGHVRCYILGNRTQNGLSH